MAWYGGGTRQVQTLSATGHWFKSGQGLVPLRWVFVWDRTGTHRDEYFYITDRTLTPTAHIGLNTGWWNLEKAQADYPSRRRWGGSASSAYNRLHGVAGVGRVVSATPGQSHRRSLMSSTPQHPTPPRA